MTPDDIESTQSPAKGEALDIVGTKEIVVFTTGTELVTVDAVVDLVAGTVTVIVDCVDVGAIPPVLVSVRVLVALVIWKK